MACISPKSTLATSTLASSATHTAMSIREASRRPSGSTGARRQDTSIASVLSTSLPGRRINARRLSSDASIREAAFIARVNDDVVRKGFVGYDDLRTAVYAALAKHLEDKGLINVLPFDCSNSANIQLKDLSTSKMRQFVRDARIERKWNVPVNATPVKILEALRLIDDNGHILNPAALLFGKDPQRYFPASCVKCAWFLTDRVEKPMADHQIYTGDVFKMVDDATFFVMSHISNQIGPHDAAGNAAATSRFELPEPAVREAIVNAVCHRDYASAASVQVMLFKDRLEIWSPGPLPKGMTLAKMYKRHKSYPANPLLAYAMFLRKYVEQTGTGTGDIIARCREWGLPDPKWQVEATATISLWSCRARKVRLRVRLGLWIGVWIRHVIKCLAS